MPELPEVETIARDLRGLVTGARIAGAASNWPPTLRSHEPEAFAAAISGREIVGVGRRGKQLLVLLGPAAPATPVAAAAIVPVGVVAAVAPASEEAAVLTIHLKMTGQLFVVEAGAPQDRHVHLVLSLVDGRELRFRDMRKFGRIGLYRRDEATGEPVRGEAPGVLATGAEPLSDEFTARKLRELLARRRGRLKTLLLNQEFLAGVGNIYADEALWRARLHPLRDATTLRPDHVARLHGALREVLAEAVERRGSSVDDYTAPEGDGSMQEYLRVYQRAGEPCLRCGRPIRRIVVGGRSTHFCSWCQRLAGGAAGRGTTGGGAGRRTIDRTRRGPRWTELDGPGALGRTRSEDERVRRIAATRKAAAARRAAARAGGVADVPAGGAAKATANVPAGGAAHAAADVPAGGAAKATAGGAAHAAADVPAGGAAKATAEGST
jgi:formamidopyrimidine-DNA glycosylase